MTERDRERLFARSNKDIDAILRCEISIDNIIWDSLQKKKTKKNHSEEGIGDIKLGHQSQHQLGTKFQAECEQIISEIQEAQSLRREVQRRSLRLKQALRSPMKPETPVWEPIEKNPLRAPWSSTEPKQNLGELKGAQASAQKPEQSLREPEWGWRKL